MKLEDVSDDFKCIFPGRRAVWTACAGILGDEDVHFFKL